MPKREAIERARKKSVIAASVASQEWHPLVESSGGLDSCYDFFYKLEANLYLFSESNKQDSHPLSRDTLASLFSDLHNISPKCGWICLSWLLPPVLLPRRQMAVLLFLPP